MSASPRNHQAPSGVQRVAAHLRGAWPVWVYAAGLLCAVLPLWASRALPLVDLPQHLHLISVLHRLDDPTTLYPELYAARITLTPYLGYYYLVHGLSWLLPLEVANRVFLSAYVVGFALSLAFLLRSVDKPAWPSLLCLPFAYGDSFGWGFVNYVASLPLSFLTCGLFVRSVATLDTRRRQRTAWTMGAVLLLVLLFHVQSFAFLALALPWLLVSTPAPAQGAGLTGWLRARRAALLGVIPAVSVFFVWMAVRNATPGEIEPGAAWKAWGPMLSRQNLSFRSFEQNLESFPRILANLFRDGSDRLPLVLAVGVAALTVAVWFVHRGSRLERTARGSRLARSRLWGLGAIGVALYFLLPFDIHGAMYYLNLRFAHLAAPLLLVALVPPLSPRAQRMGLIAAALCALVLGVTLSRGFRAFDVEAEPIVALAPLAGQKPRVMGLMFDPGSKVMTLPVHLHAAATIARLNGGAPNFSFALTPHSPLRYRGEPPPSFASEWRPQQFSFARHGRTYDAFLVRGAHPSRAFPRHLGRDVQIAGESQGVWLVRPNR